MPAAPRFSAAIRPGLDRVRRALAQLGHPEEAFASVLVAGTNGKGSVCAFLDSILRTSGRRTGLYTSPHLIHERERIRVDGRPISPADWARLAHAVPRGATEFEAQTLIAFQYFAEKRVEAAVVEVGLGGRLDATNALPAPEVTVITSIGRDHEAWLGSTPRQIYFEKRGIARPGTRLIQNVDPALAREYADDVPVWNLGGEIRAAAKKDRVTVSLPGAPYRALPVSLAGPHQAENVALAVAAVHSLNERGWNISETDMRRGLARARWPGRFQVISTHPPLVLDGAHNPDAALALAAAWKASAWGSQTATLIFACLEDKNAGEMVKVLAPLVHRVILCPLDTPRARKLPELAALWSAARRPTVTARNFSDAARRARTAGGPVLVTGSLYLVGEALRHFPGASGGF